MGRETPAGSPAARTSHMDIRRKNRRSPNGPSPTRGQSHPNPRTPHPRRPTAEIRGKTAYLPTAHPLPRAGRIPIHAPLKNQGFHL